MSELWQHRRALRSGDGMTRPETRPASPRRPTMVDVAKRADVALKTVSRVVNNEPAVASELVDRVLAAIAELGFRRNDIARNLRSLRVNATIGLLIEEIANPFYATIASVTADIAAAHDTLLITTSSEEDPERERELLLDLTSRRVDGLLVVPAGQDHSFLRREIEMGTPVVFLDRPAGELLADTVLLDNQGGSRAGVRQLLAAGHRRIGVLLDSLTVYTMQERLAGAQAEFAAAGVRYDPALIRDRRTRAGRRRSGGRRDARHGRPADGVLLHEQPDHRRRAAGAVPPGRRRGAARLRRLRAVAPDAAPADRHRVRRAGVRPAGR